MSAPARSDVERFRALVARRLGLFVDDDKLAALAGVLQARFEATGSHDLATYEARLASEPRRELRALAEQLTIGETYFFRYADHFRVFADVVLGEALRLREGRRRLHVLSAGCASGEEPYTLAILALERRAALAGVDLRIRGVDVHGGLIERARRGRYTPWSLRETPPEVEARWFRPAGREIELDEAVRATVDFEERNLVDDDPAFWAPGAFDVVFCRNVLMYWAPETMRRVVGRIHRTLAPGGLLFLGHAETLRGLSHDFHLVHTHDTFYYRRREPGDEDRDEGLPRRARNGIAESRADPPLGPVDSANGAWVDVIARSANRIEQLARSSQGGRGESGAAPGSADLRPAVEAMRSERFDEAMAHVHALPPGSETDPDVLLLRAVLLANGSRVSEAEGVCAAILRADELHAGAHYVMALCREHAGDRRAALDHDQRAAYLDAEFAMPRLHMGLLARRAGDDGKARAALSRALEMLPREDASRILLFGGGFSREALVSLCRSELEAAGGRP